MKQNENEVTTTIIDIIEFIRDHCADNNTTNRLNKLLESLNKGISK